jgi:hypothetical protein
MVPLYLVAAGASWVLTGDFGARNVFERQAGLADGGYTDKPLRLRYPPGRLGRPARLGGPVRLDGRARLGRPAQRLSPARRCSTAAPSRAGFSRT